MKKISHSGLIFIIFSLIRRTYFWCGGGKSGYTFEPWLEFSLGGGDNIGFTNYLVGFSNAGNPQQAKTKITSYIDKIK